MKAINLDYIIIVKNLPTFIPLNFYIDYFPYRVYFVSFWSYLWFRDF